MKNLTIKFLIFLTILFTFSCSPEIDKSITGTNLHQEFHREISQVYDVNYLLYLPEDYFQASKKWPLVLFLHGSGERGTDINIVKRNGPPMLVEEGYKFPFILITPQCPERTSWDNKLLLSLLEDIELKYNVDKDRIYLTGLSMGGSGTWSFAIEYPKIFAAIVPISGGGEPDDVCALKDVPVWVFHGEKDDVVPIKEDSDMVDALRQCGGNVKFTIYPQVGHGAWVEAYNNPELYNWLLSHSLINKNQN
jgi:predicted peptidase